MREEEAARQGNKLKPLSAEDAEKPLKMAVDIDKLCPEGMTAKHYGQMYTTEFVQRCLEVANELDRDLTANVVKNIAAEVVGRLYYLILTAKGKKRKDIMKSRKGLDLNVYGALPPLFTRQPHFLNYSTVVTGDSPYATIPGTNVRIPEGELAEHPVFKNYTREQFVLSSQRRGAGWYEVINAAVVEAMEQSKSVAQAELDAVNKMMEEDYGTSSAAPTASKPAVQ